MCITLASVELKETERKTKCMCDGECKVYSNVIDTTFQYIKLQLLKIQARPCLSARPLIKVKWVSHGVSDMYQCKAYCGGKSGVSDSNVPGPDSDLGVEAVWLMRVRQQAKSGDEIFGCHTSHHLLLSPHVLHGVSQMGRGTC